MVSMVGSIFKGKVNRVLPGIPAAFVEIGQPRAAFLYVDDVLPPKEDLDEEDTNADGAAPEVEESTLEDPVSISTLLNQGQEITVQVRKASLGTKGPRVSTQLTMPGRFVVYVPALRRVGVSRRITDEAERKRLKELVESHQGPDDGGYIVRTVCEGQDEAAIKQDMEFVRSLWADVEERIQNASSPSLVQRDLDLVLRTARDMFTSGVDRLVVDRPEQAERIKKLVSRFAPHLGERIETHTGNDLLFDHYGIEREIERALRREVRLKSGAAIVIDEAEALTAIDVNTGRFVGKRNHEDTIVETNLEAAVEIAAQIRLRDLGGIIIVDFIDMEAEESRARVMEAFESALANDRAKVNILSMSGVGLLEMTRKRVRPSLGRTLTEPCPYCRGRGRIRSRDTLALDVQREVRRQCRLHPKGRILVSAMPRVAATLSDAPFVPALESELNREVVVEAREDLHQEIFHVTCQPEESR